MSDAAALLRGLRRVGNEPQLTQALVAVFNADQVSARGFLGLLLKNRRIRAADLPDLWMVTAEEEARGNRFDLRFRARGWDVIVELKVYASYGREQLPRYLESLEEVDNAYVIAVTRDDPRFGEERLDDPRWLGSARWRDLLDGLRTLPIANELLRQQWCMFLDLLEEEGSMGFTNPESMLFDNFARAKAASRHVEGFVQALVRPLLEALQDTLGGPSRAGLYWERRPGGLSRSHLRNAVDIPFRVPKGGDWRVRAGVIGPDVPARFYVTPAPLQNWSIRTFHNEASRVVNQLVDGGSFDGVWMYASLPLTGDLVSSASLESAVLEFAHARFGELRRSGYFDLPVELFGPSAPAGSDPAPA